MILVTQCTGDLILYICSYSIPYEGEKNEAQTQHGVYWTNIYRVTSLAHYETKLSYLLSEHASFLLVVYKSNQVLYIKNLLPSVYTKQMQTITNY